MRFRSQRTSKRREKAIALQNNNNIKLQRNRKCQSTVKLKGVESHDFCIRPDWLPCLSNMDEKVTYPQCDKNRGVAGKP